MLDIFCRVWYNDDSKVNNNIMPVMEACKNTERTVFMKLWHLCCVGLISLIFVGCNPIGYNDSTLSDESSTPKSSARIFLREELEKKYGMEFEILGGSAGFMSVAEDCDVRCVEDGVEFQATLHTKDYYEVVSENYLCHKYLPQVQEDIEKYVKTYLFDFKYVEIRADTMELPFSTSPDLTYEELKQEIYFECTIFISDDRVITDEEMKLLIEKFASSNEYIPEGYTEEVDTYREELDMDVRFYLFTVVEHVYKELDYCIKWTQNTFLGKTRLL